jgi:hypothetical protein
MHLPEMETMQLGKTISDIKEYFMRQAEYSLRCPRLKVTIKGANQC